MSPVLQSIRCLGVLCRLSRGSYAGHALRSLSPGGFLVYILQAKLAAMLLSTYLPSFSPSLPCQVMQALPALIGSYPMTLPTDPHAVIPLLRFVVVLAI